MLEEMLSITNHQEMLIRNDNEMLPPHNHQNYLSSKVNIKLIDWNVNKGNHHALFVGCQLMQPLKTLCSFCKKN